MIKIALQSLISTFLILLVGLNLIFVFDNGGQILALGRTIDYSDKYFGVSTLIGWFQTGFMEDSKLITDMRSFIESLSIDIKNNLYGRWFELANIGGVTDWSSFWTAISNFFYSVGAIFQMIFYTLMFILYGVMVVGWFVIKTIMILTGLYYSSAPTFTYEGVLL